jgi:hypothetical protein
MRVEFKVSLDGGEPFDQAKELLQILIKLLWSRARFAKLIDLRRRLDSLRPFHGSSKGNPFDQSLGDPVRCEESGLVADRYPESIAQMTDHLMRRHPAPLAWTVVPDRCQTENKRGSILRVC